MKKLATMYRFEVFINDRGKIVLDYDWIPPDAFRALLQGDEQVEDPDDIHQMCIDINEALLDLQKKLLSGYKIE